MPVLSIANIYAMNAPTGTTPYVPIAVKLAIPTQNVTMNQSVAIVNSLTRQQPAYALHITQQLKH